jgi:hypothetical protein
VTLFNVANRDEYRAYSRQVTEDIALRQVLILME